MSERPLIRLSVGAKCTKPRGGAKLAALIFCVAAAWVGLCGQMNGADPSFEFTATRKDFKLYFPAYLANGFFTATTSLRGTDPTSSYMVGVMDYTPGDVSRPAAIPRWTEIDYFDGRRWLNHRAVTPAAFQDYRQTLDMFDGRLETHYTWDDAGRTTDVGVDTFISEAEPHLAVTSLTLTPGFSGIVRLRFTLRPNPAPPDRMALAKLNNAEVQKAIAAAERKKLVPTGPTALAPGNAARWYPGQVQINAFGGDAKQGLFWITGRAVDGPRLAEAAAIELPPELKPLAAKLHASARLVELDITVKLHKGMTYTFPKYVAASRQGWGGLKNSVIGSAKEARYLGLASLLRQHEAAWHELWGSDIVVEGDEKVQKAIHSDLFALLENSTADTGWGMQCQGLSPYYLGHVFWDNDSWDFPALVLLHPDRARSLVNFRFRTLPQAEARAKRHGYKGAMYPWESDPEKGIEVTPASARAFSEREIHVNGDIAIAQWQYYLVTGNKGWLRKYGYPVIRQVAEFWTSRSTYNARQNRYEIHHVTSPDEAYDDVSNDAFTNAVAQKSLRIAVAASRVLGLAPNPNWETIAQKMYIPFSRREQRHFDFDRTVPHNKHTWMGSSISWLAYPQLDLAMSKEVRRNDFNFAVKSLRHLTPDANDMVPVMLGIEAAELGDPAQSYKWLKFSMGGFLKPPFNVRSETAKNNNIYNLSISAGFLEDFLYGFTGLRITDQGLKPVYSPILPAAFKRVTLKGIWIRNQRFDFILSRDSSGKVHLTKHRFSSNVKNAGSQGFAAYVNPFVGTAGADMANTFPGAAWPFGMIHWSPDTPTGFAKHGFSQGSYVYGDDQIRGFSLTHLSGPGCRIMGDVPIMPFTGTVATSPAAERAAYRAKFSHANERASPGFYSVVFDNGARVQLTVTTRAGIGSFVFPASAHSSLLFNVGRNATGVRNATIEITGHRRIAGSVSTGGFCSATRDKYTVYFAAKFNRPFNGFGTWAGASVNRGQRSVAGAQTGGFVEFDTIKDRAVEMKVALSYVSVANAWENLEKEIPGWNFGAVRQAAHNQWNHDLGLIAVRGGTDDEKRIFYTAPYHALLYPSVFNDVNGQYIGFDGRIHLAKGFDVYTNIDEWGTYREEAQLLAMLFPKQTSDIVRSLLLDEQQGGGLPLWPLANSEACQMVGNPSPPIIADAYAFGARDFNTRAALKAMLKGATQPGAESQGCLEWDSLETYLTRGYLGPDDPGQRGHSGPSQMLEFTTTDFCIAQFARAIGDTDIYRTFMRRAQFWRNIFDSKTGYIEPRRKDGSFIHVNPAASRYYVEGNAAQYSWLVPYNLRALFALMGGNAKVVERLNRFFTELNAMDTRPYAWMGNEPSFPIPWAYDWAGAPWGAQSVTRRIELGLFTSRPDGEPGNDDLGEMSAWYVFAALGGYPVIPGVGGLALDSPLFPEAKIHLGNGKVIEIDGENASAQNPYVLSLTVNGQPSERTWVSYRLLSRGATLRFKLGSAPNKQWGTKPEDAPPSYSRGME
jgi:predicted alpha-1,2-mannosidase